MTINDGNSKMKVYLDHAATTLVLPEVVEVMKPYWSEKFGNASSVHSWGREARTAIEKARTGVAKVLNCQPEEIFFTSGATTALNLSILGYVWSAWENKLAKGASKQDRHKIHLITTSIEHHGVLDTYKYLEKRGFSVTYLPVDKDGEVDMCEFRQVIKPETILVSVMYANNEVGTIQPLADIRSSIDEILTNSDSKPVLHTDATATSGYLPLDVNELGVDMLVLGLHKFGGPKGVGILYLKKGIEVDPITFGGHHEQGLWPGTEATPLIVGAAKALEVSSIKYPAFAKASAGKQVSSIKVKKLRDKLIKGVMAKIPGAVLTGHPEKRLPEIASFCFPDVEGEAILLRLDGEGIAASSGSACTSGSLEPSHVLLAMGIPAEVAHSSIRFSLGRETTEKEIDYVLEKLPRIVKEIRSMAPKL